MEDATPNRGQRSDLRQDGFVALLKVLAVVIALLVLWRLQTVMLLVFGAALIAILLQSATQFLSDHTGIGYRPGLAITIVLILLVFGGFFLLLGNQIATEIADVATRLPDLIARMEDFFGIQSIETWVTTRLEEGMQQGSVVSGLSGISLFIANGAIGLGLVLVGGVFLAMNPSLYQRGFLAILPQDRRDRARETLVEIGTTLRMWLVGQLVAMISIGVLTTSGLLLLGIPTAFGLGFLAGLMEFVPYVGPIASAVPAIAVGLSEGPLTALWVALMYVGIQQIEGAILVPLIQRATVKLAPAVTLFAVTTFGGLLGAAGVIFAAPLTVFALAVIRKLWVEPRNPEGTEHIKTPSRSHG